MNPSRPSEPKGARLAAALVFVTIVFQHFQLFSAAGYPVTIGLFSGLLLVAVVVKRPPYLMQTVVWAILILLAGIAALASPITKGADFTPTLLLFLLTSFIVVTSAGHIDHAIVRSDAFARGLFLALLLIVAISAGQVMLGHFLNSDFLFNPFGSFQYLHEYDPGLQFPGVPRAHGFFLEPSYDAFVIGGVAVALLALGRRTGPTGALALVGLLACQSATGLIVFGGIIAIIALRSNPKLAIFALLLASVGGSLVGNYLVTRLSSISEDGTSANYRLIAPLRVVGDVLLHSPFGQPLGSVQEVVSTYGLSMAGVPASSLDNGLYVLIFYFGWAGLLAALVWFIAVVVHVLRMPKGAVVYRRIAPVWLFATLFFSGAIMAPEYGLMAWLVVVCYRQSAAMEGSNGPEPDIEHRHNHLQGSSGTASNA